MWYYAEAGQQKGPVSEADFEALCNAGTILSDTLVWREGMAEWQPYGQVHKPGISLAKRPVETGVPPEGVVCAECGRVFPPDEVIRYGDSAVCATCKPLFVQRLKEGVNSPGTLTYAGFWIRFGAKFVDGFILRVVGAIAGFIIGLILGGAGGRGAFGAAFFVGTGVGILINAAYNTFFVGAYGATPGKMAAKIKVVNEDGSKVGYGKACARYFAELLSVFTIFIGYIMAAFDDEKRALHDRICGTRVVKNS